MSPHAARWVNVLRKSAFRVAVFPSAVQNYCPEFGELVPVRSAIDMENLEPGKIAVIDPSLVDSVATSPQDQARGYRAPESLFPSRIAIFPAPIP
jgi:hypothetical protein